VMLPLPLFLNPAESMAFLLQISTLRRFKLSEPLKRSQSCNSAAIINFNTVPIFWGK
jgi:hypothetical protein